MTSAAEFFFTATVDTAKFADVAPDATTTLAGTIARCGSELLNVTVAPPLGAAEVNVIVAVVDVPPTTVVRSSTSVASEEAIVAGVTVNVVVLVTPA